MSDMKKLIGAVAKLNEAYDFDLLKLPPAERAAEQNRRIAAASSADAEVWHKGLKAHEPELPKTKDKFLGDVHRQNESVDEDDTEDCWACDGTGRDYDGEGSESCPHCGGKGYLVNGEYDDRDDDMNESSTHLVIGSDDNSLTEEIRAAFEDYVKNKAAPADEKTRVTITYKDGHTQTKSVTEKERKRYETSDSVEKVEDAKGGKGRLDDTKLSEDRKTNALWAQINDYEKRAKETKDDIKKNHLMSMAADLRKKLPVTESFGRSYAEVVAQNIPKGLDDENEILDYAADYIEGDKGLKAARNLLHYTEDFSDDVVTAYNWLEQGGRNHIEEGKKPQSMKQALDNSLSKVEPGSKLDKKIKHNNDMVRRGGIEAATMKTAPNGYHIDKKGMIKLGESKAINEGTRALPETEDDIVALRELLSKPLKASEATDALYDLVGDDDLFDLLDDIKSEDPDTDVAYTVRSWIKEHGPELFKKITQGVKVTESVHKMSYADFKRYVLAKYPTAVFKRSSPTEYVVINDGEQIGEYDWTGGELYSEDTVDEAKGKSENRALWDKINSKGVQPPIDRERYTDLSHEGLEGPFRMKTGRILYYDPKAGQYYDRDTDMYVGQEEMDEINRYGLAEDRVSPTKPPRKGTLKREIWDKKQKVYYNSYANDPYGRLEVGDNIAGPSGTSTVVKRNTNEDKESKFPTSKREKIAKMREMLNKLQSDVKEARAKMGRKIEEEAPIDQVVANAAPNGSQATSGAPATSTSASKPATTAVAPKPVTATTPAATPQALVTAASSPEAAANIVKAIAANPSVANNPAAAKALGTVLGLKK